MPAVSAIFPTRMNFEAWLQSKFPTIPSRGADAVLRLAAEGGTIPFIARYRKEQTGNLDEVAIQNVIEAKETWDKILKRQEFIVGEIEGQQKLTPELKERILGTFQLELLEDIYLPYRQKKKSKATLAREAGLEPLADWIWNCGHGTESPQPGQTLEIWAFTFRNEEKGFPDAAKAIEGAQDILIERLSENMELRQGVRDRVFKAGHLRTGKAAKAKPNSKYENYFTYNEPIEKLLKPESSHRYLALRRGWIEEELTLDVGAATAEDTALEAELLAPFEAEAVPTPGTVGDAVLRKAAKLALKAHVLPSIENEVHKALKEVADTAAIQVFAENLRKLLLASPFGPKAVLGVDPGLRTGCKLAVVDDTGKYLTSGVMHLQSEAEKKKAKEVLPTAVKTANIRAVAVGNGTAGRETEIFVRATLKEAGLDVPVVMVSEAGASVYSASEVAREEFPELDITVRGAISIARRLQDPLAELVKVDPKSIGVGQYQHDVAPGQLKRSLDYVVDSCVNTVGVQVNTASPYILARVSGIGPALAQAIVERRNAKGLFRSRQDLLEIPRFSTKTFEQAAGFLRIPEAENPLDNTSVHPERYEALERAAKTAGKSVRDFFGAGARALKTDPAFKGLKDEFGEFSFDDIVRELEKPGRDPRETFTPFSFRDDIFELKDVQPGMICPGIVTNVTNFGAFVDIGVHQDGLVHISQVSDRFVKDPRDAVSPGDRVSVKVLEVNLAKSQMALTMKTGESAHREKRPPRERSHERPERKGASAPSRVGQPVPEQKSARPGQNRPSPKPAPRAPKPIFNNAFAGLAALKGQLKSGNKPGDKS